MDLEETYLTPREVAKRLRLSVRAVYRLLCSGRIEGVRRGERGHWLVTVEATDNYLVAPRGPAQTAAPTTASAKKRHEQAMERLRAAGYRVG